MQLRIVGNIYSPGGLGAEAISRDYEDFSEVNKKSLFSSYWGENVIILSSCFHFHVLATESTLHREGLCKGWGPAPFLRVVSVISSVLNGYIRRRRTFKKKEAFFLKRHVFRV